MDKKMTAAQAETVHELLLEYADWDHYVGIYMLVGEHDIGDDVHLFFHSREEGDFECIVDAQGTTYEA